MLKSAALVVAVLVGSAAAADPISLENQIYITAGVLGGVCLLLTLAAIATTLSIAKLQMKVAALEAGGRKAPPVVAEQPRFNPEIYYSNQYEMNGRPVPPPRPYRQPPPRDNYY